MSDEALDEIDDVLSDTLGDIEAESVSEVAEESGLTVGGTVSESDRDDIVDERLDTLATELGISDGTVGLARSLRDQYLEARGDFFGTALEMVAAACLYCASKASEEGFGPSDFVDADDSGVSRKGLLRRSKDIATKTGMDPSAFFGSEQYVDRYCRELDLPEQARRRARDIVETTAEVGADSGCSPTGWAGAAVYIAAIEYDTGHGQSDIAGVANCTEVTIRNRYQEQQEVLRRLESIPTEPHAAVRYLVERTGAGSDVSTVAHELIDRSNSTETDFSAEPLLWTLAALRRAGQLVDETVSMKMLSRFTEEPSDEIAQRTNELRSVLSPREARGLIE